MISTSISKGKGGGAGRGGAGRGKHLQLRPALGRHSHPGPLFHPGAPLIDDCTARPPRPNPPLRATPAMTRDPC